MRMVNFFRFNLFIGCIVSLLALPSVGAAQVIELPEKAKNMPAYFGTALVVPEVAHVDRDGVELIVHGTRDEDHVEVKLRGKTLAVVHNDATIKEVPVSSVERIWFLGYDKDDMFRNSTDVPCVAFGGFGNDHLIGGSGDDYLVGSDHLGQDTSIAANILNGKGGDDKLIGYKANDVLYGGDGDDTIVALDGDDIINGQQGSDVIMTGPGRDQLVGDVQGDVVVTDEG